MSGFIIVFLNLRYYTWLISSVNVCQGFVLLIQAVFLSQDLMLEGLRNLCSES